MEYLRKCELEMFQVSILVPVCNVASWMARCAESLFAQSFNAIEYIFVDDCSPDNSIEIMRKVLEKYPERQSAVKVIRHEKNCGIAQTRNTAIMAASGKYVWYVDSDDYIAPDAVEKLYRTAEKSQADIVIFNFCEVHYNGRCKNQVQQLANKEDMVVQLIGFERCVSACLIFCRRELYTRNGITWIKDVNSGEDHAMTPRLVYFASKVILLPEVLYYYCHNNQKSYSSVFKVDYLRQRTIALTALEQFFSNRDYMREEIKQALLKCKIYCKCDFYRLWATAETPLPDELNLINDWCPEVPFLTLIKGSRIPYIPILIMASMRLCRPLIWYSRLCKYIYGSLIYCRRKEMQTL